MHAKELVKSRSHSGSRRHLAISGSLYRRGAATFAECKVPVWALSPSALSAKRYQCNVSSAIPGLCDTRGLWSGLSGLLFRASAHQCWIRSK